MSDAQERELILTYVTENWYLSDEEDGDERGHLITREEITLFEDSERKGRWESSGPTLGRERGMWVFGDSDAVMMMRVINGVVVEVEDDAVEDEATKWGLSRD